MNIMLFSRRLSLRFSAFSRLKHTHKENKHKDLNYLKEQFARHSKKDYYHIIESKNHEISKLDRASVLVPISIRDEHDKESGHVIHRTYYTMSKRTQNMKAFRGQVCFLGGKRDSTDKSDIQTAYREAYEEANLDSKHLHFLAELCPVITTTGSLITPIIAYFDKTEYKSRLNEREVELIFDAPTDLFLKSEQHTHSSIKSNKSTQYYMHTFKQEIDTQRLSITGVTAFISVVVSSILHSKNPDFVLDPQAGFDFQHANKFLEDYLLVKSKHLISYLAKNKKIKTEF